MNLNAITQEYSATDIRSALYYVGRYIKQASYFKKYRKDIFEDHRRSSPTEEVKQLARRIIQEIETREKAEASKFESTTISRILAEISKAEADLVSDLSQEELENGAILARQFALPKVAEK